MENTAKQTKLSQEEAIPDTKPRANGMTDEQMEYARAALAALAQRKRSPEYFKIWDEGVAEHRRMIQEELERDLAEVEKK
jgi:hypothetical protein